VQKSWETARRKYTPEQIVGVLRQVEMTREQRPEHLVSLP